MGMYSFVFLLSASLLLAQVSTRAVNITTSWALPQEGFPHFFRYFKDPTTWDDAKVICGSFHAELLTVESDQRRDAARAYLKELDVLENVWCGLQRSTIEAPFVWTGGGHDPLVGDAFWQEAHPQEPERLCVAINPLFDYRWQSFPCAGPQLSSFICQLEVPEWAEGCLVHSLPSLTVTFLPEPGVIELLSDCGLSGTKRIACKGGEKQEELMKRLSCYNEEEGHSSTQTWSTKGGQGRWDTSTPADILNAITSQMTRSSGTRHKRESGGTSTSTDISVVAESETSQSESEPEESEGIDYRMPAPEPLSPLDTTTLIAEYDREDQIEETTASVFHLTQGTPTGDQSKGNQQKIDGGLRPPTAPMSPRVPVKTWLSPLNDELTETISSTEKGPATTTLRTISDTLAVRTISDTLADTETMKKKPEGFIKEESVLTSTVENTHAKQAVETPPTTEAASSEPTVLPIHEEKGSYLPHPPLMQLRIHVKTPQKAETIKTTAAEETTTVIVEEGEKQQEVENALIITVDESGNETENSIIPHDDATALLLPEQEALVSERFQHSASNTLTHKKSTNEKTSMKRKGLKIMVPAESTVTPLIEEPETIVKDEFVQETTTVKTPEEKLTHNIPIIVIEELDEVEATEQSSGAGGSIKESLETKENETEETTTQEVKTNAPEEASTETTPAQSSDTVPVTTRPLTDKITITSDEEHINITEKNNVTFVAANRGEIEVTVASLTYEPKDTVTDAPTHTNDNSELSPSTPGTETLDVQPEIETMDSQAEEKETLAKDENMTSFVQTESGATTFVTNTTPDLSLPEESSEEAENPKRTSRGRLFQHSNPLSFYPYLINRMLG